MFIWLMRVFLRGGGCQYTLSRFCFPSPISSPLPSQCNAPHANVCIASGRWSCNKIPNSYSDFYTETWSSDVSFKFERIYGRSLRVPHYIKAYFLRHYDLFVLNWLYRSICLNITIAKWLRNRACKPRITSGGFYSYLPNEC